MTITSFKKGFKRLYTDHVYIFSFLLLATIFTFINKNFLSYTGISTLVLQATLKGIIALGMSFVITAGMIDLSVGANMAFTAAFGVMILNATHSAWLMLGFCLVVSVILSFINGLLVTQGKILPFIATLAASSIYRSIVVHQGQGWGFYVANDILPEFRQIAAGSSLGVPNLALIFLAVLGILIFIATKTKFGRYVYATGSNENAARLAGVNIKWTKMRCYMLLGACVGLSAFLFASRVTSVEAPNAGISWELDAIASNAIGGTAMSGGRGKIQGTFFGILMLQMIEGILIAAKISPFLVGLVRGVVILLAVLLQSKRNTSQSK